MRDSVRSLLITLMNYLAYFGLFCPHPDVENETTSNAEPGGAILISSWRPSSIPEVSDGLSSGSFWISLAQRLAEPTHHHRGVWPLTRADCAPQPPLGRIRPHRQQYELYVLHYSYHYEKRIEYQYWIELSLAPRYRPRSCRRCSWLMLPTLNWAGSPLCSSEQVLLCAPLAQWLTPQCGIAPWLSAHLSDPFKSDAISSTKLNRCDLV